MIRALLFDLDETLLDRTQSLLLFAKRQYRRFYPHFQHIPESIYVQRFAELDWHGLVWKDQVYQQLLAEQEVTGIGWELLLEDFVTNFADSSVGFPHIVEMLDELTRRGYKLGIVSNGRTPFQERNIAGLGIRHYFGAVLVSAAEGVRKPDGEIFMRAARRLGASAAEVVFVGDNPEADIAGAHRCGMKTIWFAARATGECTLADAGCYDLADVVRIVERM